MPEIQPTDARVETIAEFTGLEPAEVITEAEQYAQQNGDTADAELTDTAGAITTIEHELGLSK